MSEEKMNFELTVADIKELLIKEKEITWLNGAEYDVMMKLFEESSTFSGFITKLEENNFSEFKIGIVIMTIKSMPYVNTIQVIQGLQF